MKNTIWLFLIFIRMGYSYPCIDIHFTPYAGAENLLYVQTSLGKIDNALYPPPTITLEDIENPDECPFLTSKAKTLRKLKSALVWLPINASCIITQHEVFGHGYRIRDLGTKYAKVTGYKMYVIGGATSMDITNQLTPSQELTIDIAGIEAVSILANTVRQKWLDQGHIEARQGTLYIFSTISLIGYAYTLHQNPKNPNTPNDLSSYLYFLNAVYPKSNLSYRTLKHISLLNLLDPFLYYSLLSHWIYDAFCRQIRIPMISLGEVQYLPSFRLDVTPFGLQGRVDNFFLFNSIPTFLYLKWGQNAGNKYWGFGIENQKILRWASGSLGCKLDLWHSPHVLFEQGALSVLEIYDLPIGAPLPQLYPTSTINAKALGAAFSLILSQQMGASPINVFMEFGYKTDGYLPGEALRESPIARGGLSGKF